MLMFLGLRLKITGKIVDIGCVQKGSLSDSNNIVLGIGKGPRVHKHFDELK